MKNILQNSIKPGSVVVDVRARTFCFAKACMVPPKHRSVIECKMDPSGVTEAMPQLMPVFDRQVMNKGLDLGVEEIVCHSAEVYVKTMEAIKVRKRLGKREVPERLPPMEKSIPHILYHLTTYFGKQILLRKARKITASQ